MRRSRRRLRQGCARWGEPCATAGRRRLGLPADHFGNAFSNGAPSKVIEEAQQSILWADHLVLVYPLWLGGLPAKLKGFFEQTFRYGFALSEPGQKMQGLLKGRSVRTIVTMGMPAVIFRCAFGAYGVRAVERGIFWISGIRPIRHLFIGGVGAPKDYKPWLRKVEALGRAAG